MKMVVMVMAVAGFAACLVQRAHAASCPSGTVLVDLTSVGDLLDLAGALDCSGEVVYQVYLYGRLRLQTVIEVSDRKTMTVIGSNNTQRDSTGGAYDVIDAGNTSGIFRVTNGSTLTLKNLALAGGSSEAGGAVELDSYSSLIAIDCEFTENSGSKGGAISAHDSEVYIGSTTYFRHNVGDFGGAVYLSNSRIGIYGSAQFAHNSAKKHGGAVYAIGDSTIDIDGDAQFADNAAAEDGGVVYVSNSTIAVDGNAQFADNSAERHGGEKTQGRIACNRRYGSKGEQVATVTVPVIEVPIDRGTNAPYNYNLVPYTRRFVGGQ